MNKSIYKKQSAFKSSLPQYKDGGKKFAAGLAGFAKNIPMLGQVIDPLVANTDAVKDNPVAYASGDLAGGIVRFGTDVALNPTGLASSAPALVGKGLNLGSTVAEEKSNTERADRLDTAAMGMQGVGQVAGMATRMAGQFGGEGGFNFGQMFGMMGGSGSTPVVMKNGGPMGKSNKKELIEYNGATHENSPIDGIPIAKNGQQLHSGFKSQVPTNTQALVAHGETYDPNQEYIYSNELKPMKSKITFAEMSKRIDSKYKDRNDDIAKATKAKELESLANQNEEMRLAKEVKKSPFKMKGGGKLPKYFKGGPFDEETNSYNPYGLGSGTVNTFGTNQVESMNTKSNLGIPFVDNNKTVVPPTPTPDWLAKAMVGKTTADEIFDVSKTSNIDDLARTQATQRRMNNPLNTTTTPTNNNQQFTTGDKFQLAGLAPATIYNTIQALRPAEKFNPLTSSYFDAGLNDMNQNVRFNTNPILMNRNVGANQINQGSTSDAVRRANLQSLFRGTNTQLSEMAEREALANAQIKQSLGQAKIGVGAQDIAAQERARALNIDARRAKQQFGATAASQFGQGLTEFGKASNQGLSNRIGYDVLKNIAPNFTLTEYNNLVKRGMSDTEIIKFIKSK